MSSTTVQVETEQEEATQNPIVGKSPKSVMYVDPTEVLLVIDIHHKRLEHLPNGPRITIPVLQLVKQHPSGAWKIKSYWK